MEIISHSNIKFCRGCKSENIDEVFYFGNMPLAGDFRKINDKKIRKLPLTLMSCKECGLLQVKESVSSSLLFANYSYTSSSSQSLVNHFKKQAKIFSSFLDQYDKVFEIGCNDGALLLQLKELGIDVIGVDPSNIAFDASLKNDFTLYNNFFTKETAKKMISEFGKAKLIIANNMFAHLDSFDEIMNAVDMALTEDGIFSVEVHYQKDLIEKRQFDTIYHEHTCYHNINTLEKIVSRFNFEAFDAYKIKSHSGSIHVNFSRKRKRIKSKRLKKLLIHELKNNVDQSYIIKNFREAIDEIKFAVEEQLKNKKIVSAYGASGRGAILINMCGISNKEIPFATDLSPVRIGNYIPGTEIPIYPRSYLKENPCDTYLVLAWNYLEEILKSERQFIEDSGSIITPLPYPKIYNKNKVIRIRKA